METASWYRWVAGRETQRNVEEQLFTVVSILSVLLAHIALGQNANEFRGYKIGRYVVMPQSQPMRQIRAPRGNSPI